MSRLTEIQNFDLLKMSRMTLHDRKLGIHQSRASEA